MNRYFTIMIIPERSGKTLSWKMPRPLFHSLGLFIGVVIIILGIFAYDYKQILDQVYENKHLAIENKNLRDQLNIFQMKLASLENDIDRIRIFERKLRVLTGLEDHENLQGTEQGVPTTSQEHFNYLEKKFVAPAKEHPSLNALKTTEHLADMDLRKLNEYQNFRDLYKNKLSDEFGLRPEQRYAKIWFEFIKQSFNLADDYARFDTRHQLVQNQLSSLEININRIDQFLLDRESILNSTPTILPAKGVVSSYYGIRRSPYSGGIKMHEGLDLSADPGTKIFATADGIVSYAGHRSGFGNLVQVDHGYGVETAYGHAKKVLVNLGQHVHRGQVIAEVGNTGNSTGPHLHYEIRINGTAVDPIYFILD